MRTRVVIGTLYDSQNHPRVGQVLRFALNRMSYVSDSLIAPLDTTATTDSAGDFSVTLWCNADGLAPTHYTCTMPNGEKFTFHLPYGATSIRLEALLVAESASSSSPDGLLALIDAAISAHVAESDPHAQYLTQTEADLIYEPVLGNPTGNGYLLSSTTLGVRSWIDPTTVGVTDHGLLGGLTDDDHPQYHNDARADLRYVPLARTLTINGTALDLSANRSWSVGTVTSVDITAPAAGITASGGPITSSGAITLALANDLAALEGLSSTGFAKRTGTDAWSVAALVSGDIPDLSGIYQPLDSDLTAIAGLTATTDNFIVSVSSAWASRTPAQVRSTLALVPGTNVQAWDADLDAIAALSSTGFARRTASNTWSVSAIVAADLPATAVTAASYGSATQSPTFTVDAQGRLTAAANVTITPAYSSLTYSGLTTGQALRATSATAAAFGAIDIANTNAVTGILPGTNGGTGVNNGAFLLTIPATGTAALLAVGNAFTAAQSISLDNSVTNATSTLLTLDHSSSGTPAASFGTRLLFNLETTTTPAQNASAIDTIWTDATHATRTSALLFSTVNNAGSLTERMRVTDVGTTIYGSSATVAFQVLRTSDSFSALSVSATTGITTIYEPLVGGSNTLLFTNTSVQLARASNGLELTSFNDLIFKNSQFTTETARITTTGATLINVVDSATATATTALTLKHNTSGTPAASYGTSLLLQGQSTTTTNRDMASLESIWTTATDASRASALLFSTVNNAGSLTEAMRISGDRSVGIRGTASGTASGLYVPWISGDTGSYTSIFGSTNSSNNQIALNARSYSQIAVYAQTTSSDAVYATSSTGAGVTGISASGNGGTFYTNSAQAFTGYVLQGNSGQIATNIMIDTRTTGTASAGFGASILFAGYSAANTDRNMTRISSVWTDATDATRTSAITFQVTNNAAALAEVMRIAGTGAITSTTLDTATATATTVLTLGHNSSGTAAASFGSRMLWNLQSSTTADQNATAIDTIWTDATHATRTSAMLFSTVNSAGSLTERVRIAGDGKVGIGVTPTTTLHVAKLGYDDTVSNGTLTIGGDSAGVPNGNGALNVKNINNVASINFTTAGTYTDMNSSVNLQFRASGTAGVVFMGQSSAGLINIGVGTTAPASKIHAILLDATTATAPTVLTLGHNTSGTPAASYGTSLLFQGQSTTTVNRDMASIQAFWSTATDASRASVLSFSTLTAAGSLTERVRIDDSGRLGVGTGAASITTDHVVHIYGASASLFKIERSTSATSSMNFKNGFGSWYMGNDASGNFAIGINNDLSVSPIQTGLRSNNFVGFGITTPASRLHVIDTDTATTTATTVMTLGHNTSGTPGTNYGTTLLFQCQSDTTVNRDMASIVGLWSTATDASRTAQLSFAIVGSAGALTEKVRVSGSTTFFTVLTGGTAYLACSSVGTTGHVRVAQPASSANPAFAVVQGSSGTGNLQEWQNSSSVVVGSISAAGVALHRPTDAGTNTVLNVLTLGHNSSGSIAASFGTGMTFQGQSTTTADRDMASIGAVWTTATDASRASALVFSTVTAAGSLTERIRIDGAGNTGIGVSASNKLHVYSTVSADGISVDGTTNPAFIVRSSGTIKGYWTCATSTASFFTDALANDMVFRAEGGRILFGITSGLSKLSVNTTGVGIGGVASTAPLHAFVVDSGTTNTPNVTTVAHNTSGTPATGFGLTQFTTLQSSTTVDQNAANRVVSWIDATHASRKARVVHSVYDTAAREWIRGEASGTAAMIGFLGGAAVAQQTSGANLTNNVTSGGTNDTIADYSDLVIYANDAAAIRNDLYQLARKLKIAHDALRTYGLLT